MKVQIVHDSQRGNGKKMAEKLAAEFESRGASIVVGHRTELTPEQTAIDPPDILIVGAAVRKFFTSPPVRQWISMLGKELESHGTEIPYAAVFLTHAMPDKMVEGRVERLKQSLSRVSGIGEVQSEWLSGQVKDIPGPFVDGALENAVTFAANLFDRAQKKP